MRAFIVAAAFLMGIAAHAAPVTYSIQHRVTATEDEDCSGAVPGGPRWGCMSVGDVQYGSITFDDSILATDGRIDDIGPFSLWVQFGYVSYSFTQASGSGIRNQFGFAVSPTLVIEGGQLVDLIGGVYSAGDAPYVDWNFFVQPFPDHSFIANDAGNYRVQGVLTVSRVPEPATAALLCLGLLGLAFARRRTRDGII